MADDGLDWMDDRSSTTDANGTFLPLAMQAVWDAVASSSQRRAEPWHPGPWTLDPGPWTLDPGPWRTKASATLHHPCIHHPLYSSSSCRHQPVPSIRCIHQQSLSHHHCAISNDKSSSPKSTDVRYGRKWSLLEPLSHAASAAKNNFCMRETKQEK